MAGNFITKMFDNTTELLDNENSIIKLTCEMDFENLTNIIDTYLLTIAKDHKYSYNFDFDVMHHYMLRSFIPFFKEGNFLYNSI